MVEDGAAVGSAGTGIDEAPNDSVALADVPIAQEWVELLLSEYAKGIQENHRCGNFQNLFTPPARQSQGVADLRWLGPKVAQRLRIPLESDA